MRMKFCQFNLGKYNIPIKKKTDLFEKFLKILRILFDNFVKTSNLTWHLFAECCMCREFGAAPNACGRAMNYIENTGGGRTNVTDSRYIQRGVYGRSNSLQYKSRCNLGQGQLHDKFSAFTRSTLHPYLSMMFLTLFIKYWCA